MKISTRGRYALRDMIDLAQNDTNNFVPLKEIAQKEEISLKYLEGIIGELSKHNIVEGVHGKGGGYKLKKNAENYTVGEILKITEGELVPVSCLETNDCPRQSFCKTLPMWKNFALLVNNYFDNITIKDLIDGKN